jgi:hypothetical protein
MSYYPETVWNDPVALLRHRPLRRATNTIATPGDKPAFFIRPSEEPVQPYPYPVSHRPFISGLRDGSVRGGKVKSPRSVDFRKMFPRKICELEEGYYDHPRIYSGPHITNDQLEALRYVSETPRGTTPHLDTDFEFMFEPYDVFSPGEDWYDTLGFEKRPVSNSFSLEGSVIPDYLWITGPSEEERCSSQQLGRTSGVGLRSCHASEPKRPSDSLHDERGMLFAEFLRYPSLTCL